MASDSSPLSESEFSSNLLLILIFSNVVGEGKNKREAIRATWTSGLNNIKGSRVHYRYINHVCVMYVYVSA